MISLQKNTGGHPPPERLSASNSSLNHAETPSPHHPRRKSRPRPGRRRRAHRHPVDDQYRHRRHRLHRPTVPRAGRRRFRDGAHHRKRSRSRCRRARNQEAHARRRLRRAAHRRFPLQRPRPADQISARCARALDKYRINPGNVGAGKRRDEQFSTICDVARDNGKPVRIGVNGGSLNQELVMRKMQENTDRNLGLSSEEIINECMVLSARRIHRARAAVRPARRSDHHLLQSLAPAASDHRLSHARRSAPASLCISGSPKPAWALKGAIWSSTAMGILLNEGIGDTIRISLTPRARRRPPRRGLRRVRTAAGARPARLRCPASPPAPAAAAPPAPPFSSWPKAFRATSAKKCPNGSSNTKASNP